MSDTSMAAALKLTAQGESLIASWKHCQRRVEIAQREVEQARADFAEVSNTLGKWLLPPDAKQGERIAIWWIDSLVQVELKGEGAVEVTLRYRGREWSKR